MKIYISVPISGRALDEVRADIEKARAYITAQGHEAVSPLDGVTDLTLPWIDYIIADLGKLRQCDAVWFLSDWNKSKGCCIEWYAAKGMEMPLFVGVKPILCNE